VITGVEKLNLTATDNITIADMTSAASVDSITVTGAGTVNITTAALATTNFVINGSAATGAQTYNATNFATNGVGLTGGSAADTLTGSAQVDTINGGAGNDTISALAGDDTINGGDGNDTITGGTGADVINVGAGTDTYVFSATNGETQVGVIASGATLSGDVVTGMGNGDRIDLSAANNLTLADGAITVSTTFAAAAANSVVIVTGSYNATTKVFTSGAASTTNDDYLIQWNGGATATTVQTSVMVDIVGTLTASSTGEIITLTVA
jgi:Ca2+-binding RTX toxin-like protein